MSNHQWYTCCERWRPTMTKDTLEKIRKSLYVTGYFSEYLPEEFNSSDFCVLKNILLDSTNEKPYTYTMNKNDTSLERRTISIPEIGSFINVIKYLESTNTLNKILVLSENSKNSISKILDKHKEIRTFSNPYRITAIRGVQTTDEDFIGNTIGKLIKASGSVGILKLDIANFYGSFYTHNITCIDKGTEWAEEQYRLSLEKQANTEYTILSDLDKKIGHLNQKRTHGLLIGPVVSFLIAEGLMCTIDNELVTELTNKVGKSIDFARFIDDYDVFIKDEKDIPLIILIFTKVLEKYGFVLGDRKTEYIKFPFYVYEDFKQILESNSKATTSKQLLNIYRKLANLESTVKQKGGLFFLASNLDHLITLDNYKESTSLLLSIIKENAKSIPVACKTLIQICINSEYVNINDLVL